MDRQRRVFERYKYDNDVYHLESQKRELLLKQRLLLVENQLQGRIFTAGTFTTSGGDSTETVSITGVKSGMKCIAQVSTEGAIPVSVQSSICSENTVTIKLSGDPSTDHTITYMIFFN